MIVSLELAPGSIWSEAELSAKLGIGRTPVREALQRLEGDHLVRILRRHGAQITEINVVEQLLLLELRRDLDRSIARHAARRSTAQERAQLLEMAERLEVADSGRGRHPALPARPLRAEEFPGRMRAQPVRGPGRHALLCHVAALLLSASPPGPRSRGRHTAPRAVIRAVAIGDEKKAAAASDKLMDYVEEFTRATVTDRF